ncbi:hypothetical protein AB0C04_28740 [Micromonospora sp. NPDC048909]|uniref:hypothetical protein n=1 Tax=Micromonospora sp. NPDC048909 TaxID=3155643 RepID=UPI0034111A28
MVSGRWAGVPRRVRLLLTAAVLVFAYGTVVHLVQLCTDGLRPYPALPAWLALYFTSLTVLDPLAAVLLWTRRAAGLWLGCAVLVTDSAANAYANYVLDTTPGVTPGRIGQAVITLLAATLVAAAARLAPWMRPAHPARSPARP